MIALWVTSAVKQDDDDTPEIWISTSEIRNYTILKKSCISLEAMDSVLLERDENNVHIYTGDSKMEKQVGFALCLTAPTKTPKYRIARQSFNFHCQNVCNRKI